MLSVRDAAAAAPPIPPAVWLGGTCLAAMILGVRVYRTRLLIRRGMPAPPRLVATVERVARLAGLRRAPRTLIVPDRVSPMIWCGLRPTLVLPGALWRELDPQSRCAVIAHELSHVRRRDHRLFWLEALIGLVYWWHPVAWWARRRLHDEAAACCDAWVTTLIPNGRRAYAEALIATKSFLSVPGQRGAPGLTVMNGRTRQLARRLTMVMTQRVAPRSSVMGLALAVSIAAAGTLVMPSLACPPDEKEQARAVARAAAAAAKAEARAAKEQAKRAERGAKAAQERAEEDGVQYFGEAPALESMRRGRSQPAPQAGQSTDSLYRAIEEKERVLRQLDRRLQELQRRLEQTKPSKGNGRSSGENPNFAPSAAAEAAGPRTVVIAPQGWNGQLATPASPLTGVAPRAYTLNTAPSVGVADAGQDDAREYRLPEGKLESLTELMAREDVPIMIERRDGSIVIHATPEQHRVFEEFLRMINPRRAGHESGGLAPAALPHPARSSALTIRGVDGLRVQAEALREAIDELSAAGVDTMLRSEQFNDQVQAIRELTEIEGAGDAECFDEPADCQVEDSDCDDAECEGSGCEGAAGDSVEEVNVASFDVAGLRAILSDRPEFTAFVASIERIESQLAAIEQMAGQLEAQLEDVLGSLASLGDLPESPAALDEPDVPSPDEPERGEWDANVPPVPAAATAPETVPAMPADPDSIPQ